PFGLHFSSAGERLCSWSWDGAVRVWDTWSGQQLAQVRGLFGRMSHDGTRLACREGNQIKLWAVVGEEYRTLPTWEGRVRADSYNLRFCLSPDSRWLA